jgi:hypothetical protein
MDTQMGDAPSDLVEHALAQFETATRGFDESDVAHALRKITDSVVDVPQSKRLRAERSAMMFRPAEDGPSVWGTTYSPLAVMKGETGEDVFVPDIKDADEWTISYWTARSRDSKQPILRARYADLTWDFAPTVTGRRRDVTQARAAIDAYVDASGLEYDFALQPIRYVTRALTLALSIVDTERTRLVVDATFAVYDRVASPKQAGTFPFLFDNLYGNRKIELSDAQTTKVIDGLEHVMRIAASVGTPDYNPISLESAASRLAVHYRKQNRPGEVKRVWRAYGEAIERAAQDASPMLAMSWLHPVIAIYTREGLTDDADRVSRFLTGNQQKVQDEFKGFSADFKVSPKDLQKYVDALTDGGLAAALEIVAGRFVARAAEARTILDEGAKTAPLQALFPIQRVRDGHVVATIGSLAEDPEGRLINQLAQNIAIHNFFLHAAIKRMRERYSPTAEDISQWICACGFFSGREELIRQGVAAFLEADHVKAVHVLIPQIESGLRQLAAAVEVPPKKLLSKTGLMEDKNLSDLLGDDALQSVLKEDIVMYLRALLNDKRGHNVRNHVSHGLMPASFFNEQTSLRVLHVVLLLGALRVRRHADGSSAHNEADSTQ